VTHLVQSSFVANPVLADYQLPWMPRRSIASSPWRGSPLWSPKLLAQRTAQFHRARGKMLGSLLGLAGPLARAEYDLDFARRATGGRSTSLAGHLDIETLYRVLGAAGPKHPSDTVVVVEPHDHSVGTGGQTDWKMHITTDWVVQQLPAIWSLSDAGNKNARVFAVFSRDLF
jgi:hypothetical protein